MQLPSMQQTAVDMQAYGFFGREDFNGNPVAKIARKIMIEQVGSEYDFRAINQKQFDKIYPAAYQQAVSEIAYSNNHLLIKNDQKLVKQAKSMH